MGKESIIGKMGNTTMGNINSIKSKGLVYSTGQMGNNIKDIGWMENNMEMVWWFMLMVKRRLVNGKMVNLYIVLKMIILK